MKWRENIRSALWPAFSVFFVTAATVPAKQLISNLRSYADYLGLTAADNFLTHNPWAVLAGRVIIYVNFLLMLTLYAIRFVEWRQRKRDERLEIEEDYRRATSRD